MQPDFATRRKTQSLRGDWKFDARPHWIDEQPSRNDAAKLPKRNRCSACRAVENLTQCLPDRRSSCDFILPVPDIHTSSPGCLKTPHPKEDLRLSAGYQNTLGVIPTPAGGGHRPPGGNRPNTAPRSDDRRGHSDFPAGLAGDLQKIARWPSGKAPAKMKPAPNGAGGFAEVRRVQRHPSRFSVSARQTLKILLGPC
ncbi:hypothetical protein NDU88_005737 [Pleurodeles waltl]|uniref:Beta-galactosidase n=1 Tax=Pleurodeles waltl TaxID=8319 RepID=A0AAV7PHP2_PLEWA|nr:hypothetical protein NDU88_005737 [Pleurodeles waltl]